MPYKGADDKALPDNVKALGEKKRKQWVAIYNNVAYRCQEEGGEDCEAKGFAAANGMVKKKRKHVYQTLAELAPALKHNPGGRARGSKGAAGRPAPKR